MIELAEKATEPQPHRRSSRLGARRIRNFEHALLWVLLVGAVLSPVAAFMNGWSRPAPFNIPPRQYVMVAIGAAAVLASLRMRHLAMTSIATLIVRLGGAVAAASAISLILQYSANTFYTATSLLDGMAILLVVHSAARVLRWLARPHAHHVTLPAVVLADTLASVSAWSLLGFWVLVASEHRHVASGVLVFTAILLLLAFAILIPDSLAGRGLLPRSADHRVEAEEKSRHLKLMRR